MAESPQDTVRELRTLVVEYAKQETVEPLKGLGKYFGFSFGGALLLGLGYMFISIGMLRLLQGWGPGDRGHRFNGTMSWAPYAIVAVASVVIAGLVWSARGRRSKA